MKWKTKAGEEMDIKDMEDSHAQNTINMLIRNTSPQLILECILEGRETLLKKSKSKNSFELNGDIAQMHFDMHEDEEFRVDSDPHWYKEGFG